MGIVLLSECEIVKKGVSFKLIHPDGKSIYATKV